MTMKRRLTLSALVGAIMVISGCGGGSGAPKLDPGVGTSSSLPQPAPAPPPVQAPQPLFPDKPASRADAARFLNQATFGATSVEVDRLMSIGFTAWIDEQFAMPRKQSFTRWAEVDAATSNPTEFSDPNLDKDSSAWFTLVAYQPDQLRLRMSWALSQIFVVSKLKTPRITLWMDLTADNSFGTYRQLIDRVTFSPMMGAYLDYLGNSERNGMNPDQNYAREIMQLFSIGLWQLNPDGTPKLDSAGSKIPTYSQADVTGLSYVFTGLGMQSGGDRVGTCRDVRGEMVSALADFRTMLGCELSVWGYASTREHKFLGVTIPAIDQWSSDEVRAANGRKNIGIALDTLANHPNTAPFISKQLIQRFVTSNPSPAYVARVAAKFENNGAGVRGDFKAVLKQILLDEEARVPKNETNESFGKLREPILAIAQMNRVLLASDGKGNVWSGSVGCRREWGIIAEMELPFNSATVFNYYRPNYSPSSGSLASKNLVSPEMQITDTKSVQDWSKFVQQALERGGTGCGNAARIPTSFNFDEFLAESTDAEKLADKVLLLLAPGADVSQVRPALVRSISSLSGTTGQDRVNRIKLAVMMTMLTPEYRVQR